MRKSRSLKRLSQIALFAAVVAATVAADPAGAGPPPPIEISVSYSRPTLDRWFYPFASSPGSEFTAAVFSPLTATGFDPMFDNRDGQMLLGFATAADIPTGLPTSQYTITSATVKLMVQTDQTFGYDPTPDPYTSWLQPANPLFTPDPDPGRPVELFGTRFRNGFTALTFPENGPYSPVGPFGKHIRNAFPINFDGGGAAFDISDNVDDGFNPVPFAVGTAPLTPGQLVPVNTDLTFTINVADANIQNYLRQALAAGQIDFSIASIFPAEMMGGSTFPKFYCKEHPQVSPPPPILPTASAARLQLTVHVGPTGIPGDLDHNGVVNTLDLGILLSSWSIPATAPGCAGAVPCESDLNGDGFVNSLDLGILLSDWTL